MKFFAKQVHSYVEDDVQTVAFAETEDADPENYIIPQRFTDQSEPYYHEICGRQASGEEGLTRVILDKKSFKLFLSEKLEKKHDEDGLFIDFNVTEKQYLELASALNLIFENTDCTFQQV